MTRRDVEYFLSWSKTYLKIVNYLNSILIDDTVYSHMINMLNTKIVYIYNLINDKDVADEFRNQVNNVWKTVKQ